jgi:hypothetical protein
MTEPTEKTIQKTIQKTIEALQAKVQELEETQKKILLTLADHQKRIDECSIRR